MGRSESHSCRNKINIQSEEPPQNFVTISNSIAQRLQTACPPGFGGQEESENEDQKWIEKLSEIDRNHTIEQNLEIAEAQRILNSLSAYTAGTPVTTCPVDRRKIVDCYALMKGDTLRCEPEIKEFINCIDNLLYKATHVDERDSLSFKCPRKMTYRERFERTCLN